MSVPLVDLKTQHARLRESLETAIRRVIGHSGFILGHEVDAFERAFAREMGAGAAVGVASGTAALMLALRAVGVGPGDEVVTTAFTFAATAEAIIHCGARPVFADIDSATFNLSPAAVEDALTPRTKAILPVHLFGQVADMAAIQAITLRRGLRVVEDACESHGAQGGGRPCGAGSDLACYSFFPSKNIGCMGDGGAVTGEDVLLLQRVRKLRDHGRVSKYEHDEVGFGERLDALQAAILGVKLPRLREWNDARRRLAARYGERLAEVAAAGDLELPQEMEGNRHVWHLYVVRVRAGVGSASRERRDWLVKFLNGRGIGAGVHYPRGLHRQAAFAEFHAGMPALVETDRASAEVITLPIYPEMTDAEQDEVVAGVRAGLVA